MAFADSLPVCAVGAHRPTVQSIVWHCCHDCGMEAAGALKVLQAWRGRNGLALPDEEFERAIRGYEEYIRRPKSLDQGVKRAALPGSDGETSVGMPGLAPVAPERVSPPYPPMPPACAIAVSAPLVATPSQQVYESDSTSPETLLTQIPSTGAGSEQSAGDVSSAPQVRFARQGNRTSLDARAAKNTLERLLGESGICLSKGGLYSYAGRALASDGFRYVADEGQWLCFDPTKGCHANASKAEIVGAFSKWCHSTPLVDIYKWGKRPVIPTLCGGG